MRELIQRGEAHLNPIEAADPHKMEFARAKLHHTADAWARYLRISTGRLWSCQRRTTEQEVAGPEPKTVIRIEAVFRPGELIETSPEEAAELLKYRALYGAHCQNLDVSVRQVLQTVFGGN